MKTAQDDDLKRLIEEHQATLLTHAREQGIALDSLAKALQEIERLRGLLRGAASLLEGQALSIEEKRLIAELKAAAQ